MGRVRIVWGSSRGPTALSAYDAALAAANVHDYNVVHVSSVLPAGANVDPSDGSGPRAGRGATHRRRSTGNGRRRDGEASRSPRCGYGRTRRRIDRHRRVRRKQPTRRRRTRRYRRAGRSCRSGVGVGTERPRDRLRGDRNRVRRRSPSDRNRALDRVYTTRSLVRRHGPDRALDRWTHRASRHRRRSAGRSRGRSGPRLDGCRSAGRLGTRPRGWRRSRRNR